MPPAPLLSVVVPVRNEGANIMPLIAEIRAAVAGMHAVGGAEIIYVDDGSTDDTAGQLAAAAGQPGARLIRRRHRRSCGQSAAVCTGVRAAGGKWVATLDGDGQNDPADIPALLARAQEEKGAGRGPVLVAGHRITRHDTWTKRTSSRVANRGRAGLLGDATPDTGCGLKVFRPEVEAP